MNHCYVSVGASPMAVGFYEYLSIDQWLVSWLYALAGVLGLLALSRDLQYRFLCISVSCALSGGRRLSFEL